MTCSDINAEIKDANSRMVSLAEEADSITNQNIILGVVSFLIFPPLAFAMDFKDAPKTEMHGFDLRNRTLTTLGRDGNCETVHAYSVKEAIDIAVHDGHSENFKADKDGTETATSADVASKPEPQMATGNVNTNMHSSYYPRNAGKAGRAESGMVNTQPRVSQSGSNRASSFREAVATKAHRPAPVVSGKNAPPTLKDLMAMFLRGDITREEYLELRGGLNPG